MKVKQNTVLKALFNSKEYIVIILDNDLVIKDINRVPEGLSYDNVIETSFVELQSLESFHHIKVEKLKKAMEEKREVTFDTPYDARKSRIVNYAVTATPVIDNDEIEGLLLLIKENSGVSQSNFSNLDTTLLDQTQEIILLTDLNGNILFANKLALKTYEYKKDEIVGRDLSILYPSDSEDFIRQNQIRPTLDKGSHRLDVTRVTKSGKNLDAKLSLTAIKDNKDQPVGIICIAQDITEKKKVENHLLKLEQIIELANEVIGISDLEGNVNFVNKKGRELLLISDEKEFNFMEYIAPKEIERLEREILPSVMNKGRWAGESKFINRNGKKFDVLFDIFLLKDKNDEPVGMATVSHDISHLIEQRKKLEESESALIQAQKIGKLGSWHVDHINNRLTWSETIYEIFDLAPYSIKPSYDLFLSFIPNDERVKVDEAFLNHLSNKAIYDIIHKIKTQKGNVKYLRERVFTERDENGNPIKTVGIALDVTELKEAEIKLEYHQTELEKLVEQRTLALTKALDELNKSELKYKTLIETTIMGIGIVRNEKINFANRALIKMFDYESMEDFNQKSIFDHASEKGRVELLERYNKLKKGEWVPTTTIVEFKKKDGTVFTCQISVTDIIYDGEPARHASFIDIDKLIQTQKSLKVAVKELKEATKAKDNFLSIMSHEIRTPLNSIIGLGELVFNRNTQSELDQSLSILNSSAKHLLRLINDILDFNKIRSNKIELIYESVDIREVINDLKLAHKDSYLEKGLNFNVKIDREIPEYLVLDVTRIEQILNNLISNAIKFTDKGSITLNLNLVQRVKDKVRVAFTVSDTGIGISESDQEGIFEPFEQAKNRKSSGTGLGLSIVKNLTDLLEGQLKFKSELNKGTEFELIFDFKIGEKTRTKGEVIGEVPSLFGKSILYVEDVFANQYLMKAMLEDYGLLCDIADNGIIGLQMFEKTNYDLILMDIQMPEMDGYQTTRYIRGQNRGSDIPIIAFTADASVKTQARIKNAGMNDFLIKPVDTKAVIKKIKEYLSERSQN